MTAELLDTEQGFASERKNGKARTHFVFVDVLNIISCFAVVCFTHLWVCFLLREPGYGHFRS